MERRLTNRQTAVLAAVERLGRCSVPDLGAQLPGMMPSAIAAVLAALERRGLIRHAGNRSMIYMGGVEFWPTARAASDASKLHAAAEALRRSTRYTAWVDEDRRTVSLLVPMSAVLAEVTGSDADFSNLRAVVKEMLDAEAVRGPAIETDVVADGPIPSLQLNLICDPDRLSQPAAKC